MRRLFKTGATKALIGVSIACALASPALAAKPASGRHYAHHDTDKRNTCALCLAHLSLQWRAALHLSRRLGLRLLRLFGTLRAATALVRRTLDTPPNPRFMLVRGDRRRGDCACSERLESSQGSSPPRRSLSSRSRRSPRGRLTSASNRRSPGIASATMSELSASSGASRSASAIPPIQIAWPCGQGLAAPDGIYRPRFLLVEPLPKTRSKIVSTCCR